MHENLAISAVLPQCQTKASVWVDRSARLGSPNFDSAKAAPEGKVYITALFPEWARFDIEQSPSLIRR